MPIRLAGAGAHPRVRMIRAVTTSLLARDAKLTDQAARRLVFHEDLDHVASPPPAFGGPRLARAVLDLAAANADAGDPLAERTAQWKKIATVDGWLHPRLVAAHLTARTPDPQAAAPDQTSGRRTRKRSIRSCWLAAPTRRWPASSRRSCPG